MAALMPHYFVPNMLQTQQDTCTCSSEDSEVDNQKNKTKHFADLVKDTKSVAGFSASHQFQVGWNDIT